jgi:transposase
MKRALKFFLDDPKVGLDNNVSERALRIVALGRKNFLFA